MKKLNIVFSFVLLSFCLLINVSYAEFSLTPMSSGQIATLDSVTASNTAMAGYTYSQIRSITLNHFSNVTNSDYESLFNAMVEALKTSGYSIVIVRDSTEDKYFVTLSGSNISVGARYVSSNDRTTVYTTRIDTSATSGNFVRPIEFYNSGSMIYSKGFTIDGSPNYVYGNYSGTLLYSSIDIKEIVYADGPTWDGSSYFYKVSSPDQPENPTMPTNAEIASAVQMFYNSVYQLPNTAFKDFVVLYDNTTGLYTYIGHNRDNSLGQVIVEPNGYYEGYKFDVQWWKFYLESAEDEWWFENIDGYFSYFVYTSDGTIENLNYVGKSNISGLIEKSGPWATANTVIVYSTNDYPVKYVTFSDDSPDPVIQTGTIQGDQYTYDENLDITDNQYNPLDNFISINYPSTLVGNADFDSFLNTFNENKDVLVLPQNANWVILANTSLFSYFGSFIIMCTLFIIIERIMRG